MTYSIPSLQYTDEELCQYFTHNLILDLGSGLGKRSLFLHSKGFKTVSFDINQSYLKRYSNKIQTVQGNINNKLPFQDNSFSGVLCTEVLEHSHNPEQVIQEINRVLKLGGTLVITTPTLNLPLFRNVLVKIYRKLQNGDNYHVHKHVFSTKTLRNLLEKYFKIQTIEYTRFTILLQQKFGISPKLGNILQSLSHKIPFLQYFAQGNIIVGVKNSRVDAFKVLSQLNQNKILMMEKKII